MQKENYKERKAAELRNQALIWRRTSSRGRTKTLLVEGGEFDLGGGSKWLGEEDGLGRIGAAGGGGGAGNGWRSLSSINAAGKGRRDAVGVAFSARREEDMLRPLLLS
jgi:hypothetical protein